MIRLTDYKPHIAQQAFHYAVDEVYRYTALISGIRGGKTYSGARQAAKEAWNAKEGVFIIVAPNYPMLDRTTWEEFKKAAGPLIKEENNTKKIITLINGNKVHGHSAEHPDRIRNETANGFWIDEARECKDFATLWNVLLGRVLSTGGKGFVTTSPNSYDDIHDIFIDNKKDGYGTVRFATYANTYISPKRGY